jgi:hypothetical protein
MHNPVTTFFAPTSLSLFLSLSLSFSISPCPLSLSLSFSGGHNSFARDHFPLSSIINRYVSAEAGIKQRYNSLIWSRIYQTYFYHVESS